jgi:YjbE family integral membrane protein
MEFMSAAWWSALLAIILIDLVLAGDNAIVIALAARHLPDRLKRRAIVWGTVGAIAVRSLMTLGVVWLLKIPGLMLLGGLGLLWVAYKLLAQDGGHGEHRSPAATTFWGAMKTIVVADALMGVDNVLGVAGTAQGAMDLVIIGLLISVPIVVVGSAVVLKLVERFPVIIKLGAAVLAATAAKMIISEPVLDPVFDPPEALMPSPWWACCWLVTGPADARPVPAKFSPKIKPLPTAKPFSARVLTTPKGVHHGQNHCVCGRCRPRVAATGSYAGQRQTSNDLDHGGLPAALGAARQQMGEPQRSGKVACEMVGHAVRSNHTGVRRPV